MFLYVLAFLVLGLWLPGLHAHALLDRAEPAPGSVAAPAPAEIDLRFDSALEHAFCAVRLEGPNGSVFEPGEIRHTTGDARRLSVPLPALQPGSYRVRWSIVSTDGHQTEGDYRFTVK